MLSNSPLCRFIALFMFMVTLALVGCGDPQGKPIPVQGKVTLKDKPLPKGTITFHPDASKGNKYTGVAVGNIENGQYTVAVGVKPGAPAGWYKVTVEATAPSDPKNEYSLPKSLIQSKFNKPESSGLTAEVKEGTPSYDFTVTP